MIHPKNSVYEMKNPNANISSARDANNVNQTSVNPRRNIYDISKAKPALEAERPLTCCVPCCACCVPCCDTCAECCLRVRRPCVRAGRRYLALQRQLVARCDALDCPPVFTNKLDKLDANHHFLLCIPLRHGAVLIALLGDLYSVLGLYCFLHVSIHRAHWDRVYKDKMDILVFMYMFSFLVALLIVPSVVLTLGVLLRRQTPIVIYMYCCAAHLLLTWSVTCGVAAYCVHSCLLNNGECFTGPGQVQVALAVVSSMVYSFVWLYVLVCVNSFRKLRCPRKVRPKVVASAEPSQAEGVAGARRGAAGTRGGRYTRATNVRFDPTRAGLITSPGGPRPVGPRAQGAPGAASSVHRPPQTSPSRR